MAVEDILKKAGYGSFSVTLGKAVIYARVDRDSLERISESLSSIGFSLLSEKKDVLYAGIKSLVIEYVRNDTLRNINLSEYISGRMHYDYTYLARIFSEMSGKTVERFHIEQKVELAKELVGYGEMTMGEIADTLGYSSTAHFSSQFKSVTGMSPTEYRKGGTGKRRTLDSI